jgi:hypothetical protein
MPINPELDLSWIFATDKLTRFASLSSPTSCAADMPLSYMISSQQPSDRTRFLNTSSGSFYFDIDLSIPMTSLGLSSWRLLAMVDNNSGSNGIFRVTGASSPVGITSPTYDSGDRNLWPSSDAGDYNKVTSYIYEPDGRTETYLRVTIIDPSPRKVDYNIASGFSAVTYFEIGNLIVDFGFQSGDFGGVTIQRQGLVRGRKTTQRASLQSETGSMFPRAGGDVDTKSFTMVTHGPGAKVEYSRALAKLRRDKGLAKAILFIDGLNDTDARMESAIYGLFMDVADVPVSDLQYYEISVKIAQMV